jgi:hypothetical protein
MRDRREEKEKMKKMTAEKTMIITNKKLTVRIDCEKREEKKLKLFRIDGRHSNKYT